MNKNVQSFAIIFLGVCILIGSWMISQPSVSQLTNLDTESSSTPETMKAQEQYRYQMFSPNETNIIIFDRLSGEYWRKHINPNEGPTVWEKQPSPFTISHD